MTVHWDDGGNPRQLEDVFHIRCGAEQRHLSVPAGKRFGVGGQQSDPDRGDVAHPGKVHDHAQVLAGAIPRKLRVNVVHARDVQNAGQSDHADAVVQFAVFEFHGSPCYPQSELIILTRRISWLTTGYGLRDTVFTLRLPPRAFP